MLRIINSNFPLHFNLFGFLFSFFFFLTFTVIVSSSTNFNTSGCSRQINSTAIGFKGKFYALSLQGTLVVIKVIDSHPRITTLSKKGAAPSVSSKHFRECFVESNGEILLAFLISRKSMNIIDCVEVYRLDIGNLTWIKVESLRDTTLFIRANCCMSVLASKVGCRRNCVYFSRRSADGWCVYDMEINTISSGWSESNSSKRSLSWDEPYEERILNPVVY